MAEQKNTLHQKIFEIANILEISKDKSKAGHYKFYNIEDVLTVLKPLLNERRLLLRFKHGGIRDNIYTLCLEICDLETGEMLEDEDNQLIDTHPKVMSLAQSVNVSKTFLKKNMLNNLFNIKEPDPDYDPTQPPKPKKPPKPPRQPQKPQTPPAPKEPNDKIDNNDIKYFYAIFNKKFEKTRLDTEIDDLIKKAFKVESKKDIKKNDLRKMIEYADKATPDQIIKTLNDKIAKNNKK